MGATRRRAHKAAWGDQEKSAQDRLHRQELAAHKRARARLVALAEGNARWAIPVFSLGEFLRVVTHHRLFDPPSTPSEACRAMDQILGSPSVSVLLPGERYWSLLQEA